MAFLGNTFDPSEAPQDDRSFEPMPAGDYVVQIVDSEIVQTSKGGDMLKLTMEVIEGPFSDPPRKVWDNLNIRNANATAQGIAHRTLADICAACGIGPIQDSDDLHFKPIVATLKIEPERTVGDKTYDARNGVKRYKARNGAAGAPAGKAPAQRAAAPASQAVRGATGSRPWNNPQGAAAARDMDDNIPF